MVSPLRKQDATNAPEGSDLTEASCRLEAMIVLETERLLLRHIDLTDAGAMNQLFEDPEVMRFGDGAQSAAWVQNWIRECLQHDASDSGFGPWAVVKRERLEVIGYCGLFNFPDINGKPEVEIGYRLVRADWGKGYATEAVLGVRDYAFNKLNLKRLIALIDPENTASVRVALKAGMRLESEVMLEGYSHPDHVYVIER
jgi:[ribosomal protein S5]-alanine N-acetyltransferase